MILGDRMADTPAKVEKFLEELYVASKPAAFRDYENIRKFAAESGHKDAIERWDWAYYSEKLKKKLYDIDDEILKPYFSLEKVEQAVFGLAAGTLWYQVFLQQYNSSISSRSKDLRSIR